MSIIVEDGTGLTTASGIYAVVNRVTGKCYVGSAVNLRGRRCQHFGQLRSGKHHSPKLQRSWNKHGEHAFHFEVIELCERSELLTREQLHIDARNSFACGYNSLKTAGSRLGMPHSEESKAKVSAAKIGTKRAPFSDKWRASLSAARRGKKLVFSADARANIAAAARARKTVITPEMRYAQSLRQLKYRAGYDALPEDRVTDMAAKASAQFKGVPKSPEQRARMAESGRRAWERRRAA